MQGAAPLARGGNPYYMGTEMVETIRASRRQYAVLSSTTSRWGAPTDGDAPRDLAYDLSTAQPGLAKAALTDGKNAYRSSFPQSDEPITDRFAAGRGADKPLDAVYNVDSGSKMTCATNVQRSQQRYSAAFRTKQDRFGKGSFLDTKPSLDVVYDIDHGDKATLLTAARNSGNTLKSSMNSTAGRFGRESKCDVALDVAYNTDTGNKKCMTTAVEDSARLYSQVRSKTTRFEKSVAANSVDTLQYNTDCYGASKPGFSSGGFESSSNWIAKNPQTCSVLRTKTSRFPKEEFQDTPGPMSYEIDKGSMAGIAKIAASNDITINPRKYHQSRTSRFSASRGQDQPLDVVYNLNTGRMMDMATTARTSPMEYSIMRSTAPRFPQAKAPQRAAASGSYEPNVRLLERLNDHFRKQGKLRKLQEEYNSR